MSDSNRSVSPETLQEVFDSLDSALIAVDEEGCVRLANDAAEMLLGRSRSRLTGAPLSQSGEEGSLLATTTQRVLSSGRSLRDTLLHKGNALPLRATPWWTDDRITGVVLLIDARSTLAPREEPDVAALAAGLAHEVRNPLAAMRGAAELLAAESGGNEFLDLIVREAVRVDALVERMLSLSRPLDLEWSPVEVSELLHELALQARALARARGIDPTVEECYDPALPPLIADRQRLFEALGNLVKNAVEALPGEGGEVVLEAAMVADLRRRDTTGRAVPLVRFSVRDNGPGLRTARDRLFTPFFTTKPTGSGLGLSLARRTIDAHGGVLTLMEPAPPRTGVEAQVLLPLRSEGNEFGTPSVDSGPVDSGPIDAGPIDEVTRIGQARIDATRRQD